ncbi:MAG: pilus assembly protein TadG-related protein [Actinomycetes bacterium]
MTLRRSVVARPSATAHAAGRVRAVLARREDGQLLLLVLVYAVIAGLLVTVVVNLSKAYLYRRSLVAAADGAALTAANQPDLGRIYAGAGPVLPLSETGARAAVAQYSRDADLATRFNGFRVVDVSTDGQTVTVTLRAVVRMPFANLLTSAVAGGYHVDATARARSPLTP